MFDFAALPPEINSGRMYSGPGAGPLLSAATAWDGLSTELHSAAVSAQSVITELTGSAWSGPSAISMAAAAAPHISWLATTATQAEQTAIQARAAAAAYETAFAMTVPPAVVAANRALLAELVATNILGQNTPAILTTEAHYAEMWAQDAIAMHGYAGSAAANSSTLTPFTAPTTHTNPAGPTAALAQAAGTSADSHAQTLTQLTSALNTLASPTATTAPPTTGLDLSGISLSSLPSLVSTPTAVDSVWVPTAFVLRTLVGPAITSAGMPAAGGMPAAAAAAGELVSDELGLGAGGSVLAGVGQAGSLGSLSVPPAWAGAAPATDVADLASPATAAALPDAMRYINMAMAGLTGLAVAGTARVTRRNGDPATAQPMPAQTIATSQPPADTAAELRELAEIIESGVLTDEMLNELLSSGMLPEAVTE